MGWPGREQWVELGRALLTMAALAPAAWQVGKVFQRGGLPQITGYLVTGLLSGPHALKLLDPENTRGFWVAQHASLALVAACAGSELRWEEVRRSKRQVGWLTVGISLSTWAFVFLAFLVAAPRFLAGEQGGVTRVGMASLAATLSVARSPASCIAVLREVEGKGPFSSLVLAVTVVKDALVVALFALNLEAAVALLRPSPEVGLFAASFRFLAPCLRLGAGVGLGGAGGFALARVAKTKQPAAVCAAVVALSLAADLVTLEGLLVCLVTGLVACNLPGEKGQRDRENAEQALGAVSQANNCAFFTMVGSSLRLGQLAGMLKLAILLFAVRLAAIHLGCLLGSWLGGVSSEHARLSSLAMVTQAGIALGLASSVRERFPEWGPDFSGLLAAVVVLNQLLGPPMFKAALMAVGEAKSSSASSQASAPAAHSLSQRQRLMEFLRGPRTSDKADASSSA